MGGAFFWLFSPVAIYRVCSLLANVKIGRSRNRIQSEPIFGNRLKTDKRAKKTGGDESIRLPRVRMMLKLHHVTDSRTHRIPIESRAVGHKPNDLAPPIGLRRQHDHRSALHPPDCHGMVR